MSSDISSRDRLSPWHPAALAATWCGVGLLPRAPGTWGSAAALPFAWGLTQWGGSWAVMAAAAVCFVVGWWASAIYMERTGSHDPGEIVIDEVAGQWMVLAFVPADPILYAAGFVVFRVFDIWKPFPVGWADRTIGGGLGVMADDALAAFYGMASMAALVAMWGAI